MGRLRIVTRALVDRINKLVGYGLSYGVGDRGRGTMCVQACVQAALEEEHNDQPFCVPPNRKQFGISLNDAEGWDSDMARGKGLKRFAIAQLGESTKPEEDFYPLVTTQLYEKRFHVLLKDAGADDDDVEAAKKVRNQDAAERLIARMRASAEKLGEELSYAIEELSEEAPSERADIEELKRYFYPDGTDNDQLCELAEVGVQACIKMRTEGSEWLEKYEEKKGAERDKFIKQETKKGLDQEAAARRFAAQNGAQMKKFLNVAVDENPEGNAVTLDEILEQLSKR